jgi:hypothetical protein
MSSLTAERRPVRKAARWLARIEAVAPMIRMAMLVMTGLSTALVALSSYGLDRFALPLVGTTLAAALVFTYLYTEGGVYNQQNRDRKDMGNNHATPLMRIDDELIGCAVFAAVHGRPPSEDERESIAEAVDGAWHDHRDGVEVER